jgi:hypothetical protein
VVVVDLVVVVVCLVPPEPPPPPEPPEAVVVVVTTGVVVVDDGVKVGVVELTVGGLDVVDVMVDVTVVLVVWLNVVAVAGVATEETGLTESAEADDVEVAETAVEVETVVEEMPVEVVPEA